MTKLTQKQRFSYASRLHLLSDFDKTLSDMRHEIARDKYLYPHGTFFQKIIQWDLGDGMTAKACIEVSLPGSEDHFAMMNTLVDSWEDDEEEDE